MLPYVVHFCMRIYFALREAITQNERNFPANAYCIIHIGRCGSSVLGRMLMENRRIGHQAEILTRSRIIPPHPLDIPELEIRNRRDISPEEFFDFVHWCARQHLMVYRFFVRWAKVENYFYGFEIKFHQINKISGMTIPTFVTALREKNVIPIFLCRKNALRRIVSIAVGMKAGTWHAQAHSDTAPMTIILDPEKVTDVATVTPSSPKRKTSLLEALRRDQEIMLQAEKTAQELNVPLLFYEDFESDPMIGVEFVSKALGVAPHKVDPPLKKTGNKSLSQQIENYEEIAAYLKDTEFSWMLD